MGLPEQCMLPVLRIISRFPCLQTERVTCTYIRADLLLVVDAAFFVLGIYPKTAHFCNRAPSSAESEDKSLINLR